MSGREALLGQITFIPQFDQGRIGQVNSLGYLSIGGREPGASTTKLTGLHMMGFAMPRARSGGLDPVLVVTPSVRLDEINQRRQTLDHFPRGIGDYVFNTPSNELEVAPHDDGIGVFSFTVDPNRPNYLDGRIRQDATILDSISQWRRRRQAQREGLAAAMTRIHTSYGEAEAVLFNVQTPFIRDASQTTIGVQERFIVPRSPLLKLHRIGTFRHANSK